MTDIEFASFKPKIPKLEKMDGSDPKWRKAHFFNEWLSDALEIIDYQNMDRDDIPALTWVGWHLKGDAKNLYRQWRRDPDTVNIGLNGFFPALRELYIPSTYVQELWNEFQNIRQYSQGRLMTIHQLANKIKDM